MPTQPIAFCITELNAGGAERALVQLVTRLDRSQWQPHVFCLQGRGELVDVLEQAGISITCLHGCCAYDLRTVYRLQKHLRRLQPVLLQTFLFQANVIGSVAGRWSGFPVVTGIRVAEKRKNLVYRLEKWLSPWASRHVCVSRGVSQIIQQQWSCPAEKMTVIPNGIELDRFQQATALERSQLGLSDTQPLLLYVGRLDEQKGVMQFIPIIKQLRQRYPQVVLLIAGDGGQRNLLEQQMKQANLQQSIRLLGHSHEIPRLLKTADLFVFPSRWEGMPNAVLEAMAARLPIVTTAVEGVSELIEPDVSGAVVPIDDVQKMVAAISNLIDQPTRRQQYAAAAFTHLQQNYSWDKTAAEYETVYRQILTQAQNVQSPDDSQKQPHGSE